jgi:hypothetical protein
MIKNGDTGASTRDEPREMCMLARRAGVHMRACPEGPSVTISKCEARRAGPDRRMAAAGRERASEEASE